MQMRADHTAFMYLLNFHPLHHNKSYSRQHNQNQFTAYKNMQRRPCKYFVSKNQNIYNQILKDYNTAIISVN